MVPFFLQFVVDRFFWINQRF